MKKKKETPKTKQPAKKMTTREVIAHLKKRQAGLAQERDWLRELVDEMEELISAADDAHEHLVQAIDRLSELV